MFETNTLAGKINLLVLMPLAGVLLLLGAYFLPLLGRDFLRSREQGVGHAVEGILGVLQSLEDEVQARELTREQAQRLARLHLQNLRFERNGYFWVQARTSLGPRIVFHPLFPAWEGKLTDDLEDPRLRELYRRLEAAADGSGGGFLRYDFSKPGQLGALPKTSYVAAFRPWGWIIGSGVYHDDVWTEAWSTARAMLVAFVLLAGIMVATAGTLSRRIARPLRELVDGLRQGDLDRTLQVHGHDEVALAAAAFNDYNAGLRARILQLSGPSGQVAFGSIQLEGGPAGQGAVPCDLRAATERILEAARALQRITESRDSVPAPNILPLPALPNRELTLESLSGDLFMGFLTADLMEARREHELRGGHLFRMGEVYLVCSPEEASAWGWTAEELRHLPCRRPALIA